MVKVKVVPGTIDGKTEEAETTSGGFVVFFPSSFSTGDEGAGGVWMGIWYDPFDEPELELE